MIDARDIYIEEAVEGSSVILIGGPEGVQVCVYQTDSVLRQVTSTYCKAQRLAGEVLQLVPGVHVGLVHVRYTAHATTSEDSLS